MYRSLECCTAPIPSSISSKQSTAHPLILHTSALRLTHLAYPPVDVSMIFAAFETEEIPVSGPAFNNYWWDVVDEKQKREWQIRKKSSKTEKGNFFQ